MAESTQPDHCNLVARFERALMQAVENGQ